MELLSETKDEVPIAIALDPEVEHELPIAMLSALVRVRALVPMAIDLKLPALAPLVPPSEAPIAIAAVLPDEAPLNEPDPAPMAIPAGPPPEGPLPELPPLP